MEATHPTSTNEERIEQIERDTPTEAAATVPASKLFRYSEFVDVGEGAAECEHSRDGECQDIGHFHAWCRLPNPYQQQDIRAKGLAAQARKIRELRDPESDASVVLDQQLADINDPVFVNAIVDELVGREWAEDYIEAQRDVEEREEFEHIDQDREEYNRLDAAERTLSEEEQSDEYKRLSEHLGEYIEALRVRMEEIQAPKKDELRGRGPEELVALVRSKRVEEQANRAFTETYNAWMWYVGTFQVALHPTLGRPHLPAWEEMGVRDRPAVGTMFSESEEVVEALKRVFTDLQLALHRGTAAGN